MTSTAVQLDTAEQVIAQYSQMIWRQTHRCLAKLPAHTTFEADDLYQEGVAQALVAFATYRRTHAATTAGQAPAASAQGAVQANGKRRASFTTYLQAAVMHRYGKVVKKEWKTWGNLMDPAWVVADGSEEDNILAMRHPAYAVGG